MQLYDVTDKQTGETLMTIEAADVNQALERVWLCEPWLKPFKTPNGVLSVYEHHPDEPVTGPTFFDGHFRVLAAKTSAHH